MQRSRESSGEPARHPCVEWSGLRAADRKRADADELAALKPAAELAEDNAALRARIAELERDNAEVVQRYSEQKSRRKNMLSAAGLIGAGVLGGLVLPWLGRSTRRRRYSDF